MSAVAVKAIPMTRYPIGTIVRLKGNRAGGDRKLAVIQTHYGDIDGGVRLDRILNEFRSWNVMDLEPIDNPDAYRVEEWLVSGVRTGFRVVRYAGRKLEIAKGFTYDSYKPGSFASALRQAHGLAAKLNAELIGVPA